MPRIKRWFPVSHDINRDPEVWQMRETFGEKSLSIWLEVLSIADRNEGSIPGDERTIADCLAWCCRTHAGYSLKVWRFIADHWLTYEQAVYKVANFAKYHRIEERNAVPPDLTRPNLTKPDLNKTPKPTPQPAAAKRDGPLAELKKLKRPSDEEAAKNVELLRSMIGYR